MDHGVDFTFLIPYLNKLTQDGFFYNPAKLLTYKRPFNCMQTSRSVGKTTVFMAICILNYCLKNKQFVYVRRTDTETLEGARDFFVDVDIVRENFPELGIKTAYYEAGKFFVVFEGETEEEERKEEMGRTMPLSFVGKRKSSRPQDANIIIFDEFVAMYQKEYLGTVNNLTEEYDRLILLYQSIDRAKGKAFKNETAIFCLGNSSTLYNPVFLGLNCLRFIQKESRFIAPKNGFYVVERLQSVPATKEIESSFSYIMTSEAEKRKMYKNDTGEFESRYVSQKPDKSICLCNFILNGKTRGLYYSDFRMVYYIGKPDNSERTYSLDIEGHEMTDCELIYAMKDFNYSGVMINAYKHGRLFFSDVPTQKTILSYLKIQ